MFQGTLRSGTKVAVRARKVRGVGPETDVTGGTPRGLRGLSRMETWTEGRRPLWTEGVDILDDGGS